MKTLNRDGIQRMIESGSGSVGGGVSASTESLAGYATQMWVNGNYISIKFFSKLFQALDENGDPIDPNDMDTVIDSIQSMFGFWTNAYISALGQNDEGGEVALTLASLADVDVSTVSNGDSLVWNAALRKWVPGSSGIDLTAMWAALATNGNQQIDSSHLSTALSGYATQTWVVQQGYITASALNGYATESWVGTQISDMATQTWVGNNYLSQTDAATTYLSKTDAANTYLSIAFFARLFRAYNGSTAVNPNDTTSTIDNIKAMFGFWTEQYISALGNSGGGSAYVTMDQVWTALGNATNEQINISHLSTALSGYATTTALALYNPTNNFKTINGYSIIGTGDINVGGGGGSYLPLSGGTLTGSLQIYSTVASGGWNEGIRMHIASDGWCGVVMCGSDNTGSSGTSAKTWSMHNNDGHFYLVLNGANNYTYGLDWTEGGSLSVKGTSFTYNGSNVLTEAYTGFYPISGGALNSNSHIVIGDTNRDGNWSSSYISCGAGYGKYAGVYGVRLLVTHQQDSQWGLGSDLNPNIVNGYDSCIAGCLSSTNYCHISFVTHNVNSSTYYEIGHFDYASGEVTFYVKGGIEANTGNFTASNNALSLTSSSEDSWIYYKTTINGTLGNRASSGYYRNFAFIANEATYARIGVNNSGTPQYWDNAVGGSGHEFTLLHSGNVGSYNAGSATKLQTARTIWGQSFDGSSNISGNMSIYSTGTSWVEGIRVHVADNGWCGVIMCGSDNTGNSGTSAKTWSMHNNDGYFYIAQNGSNSFTNGISCVNGNWAILCSGNVGVGTTSPSDGLHLEKKNLLIQNTSSNNGIWVELKGVSEDFGLAIGSGNTNRGIMDFKRSNWMIYFDASNTYCDYGNFVCSGGVTALSDARHKSIVGGTEISVEQIARMRSVKFLWNDGRADHGVHVGSIAQDWQNVLPEVVLRKDDAEGTLSLNYGVAALISVITTARKVVDHERRIKELEKENERLRFKVEQFKIA